MHILTLTDEQLIMIMGALAGARFYGINKNISDNAISKTSMYINLHPLEFEELYEKVDAINKKAGI